MDKRPSTEEQPQASGSTGGLYKGVNVTIKTLNILIVCGIILVVVMIFIGQGKGYAVTYESAGGSDVAFQKYQYQEDIDFPEPPTREGYVFKGWSTDPDGNRMVEEGSMVTEDVTLYAIWEPEK